MNTPHMDRLPTSCTYFRQVPLKGQSLKMHRLMRQSSDRSSATSLRLPRTSRLLMLPALVPARGSRRRASLTVQAADSSTQPFSRDLRIGDRGRDVRKLQVEVLETKATGKFDAATYESVRSWQTQNDLPSTGVFGPLSRQVAATQLQAKAVSKAEVLVEEPQAIVDPLETSRATTVEAADFVDTVVTITPTPAPQAPSGPSASLAIFPVVLAGAALIYAVTRPGGAQSAVQWVAAGAEAVMFRVLEAAVVAYFAVRRRVRAAMGLAAPLPLHPAPAAAAGPPPGAAPAPAAATAATARFQLDERGAAGQPALGAAPPSGSPDGWGAGAGAAEGAGGGVGAGPGARRGFGLGLQMPDDDECIATDSGRHSRQWDYYIRAMERRQAGPPPPGAGPPPQDESESSLSWSKLTSWARGSPEPEPEPEPAPPAGEQAPAGGASSPDHLLRLAVMKDEAIRKKRVNELTNAYGQTRPAGAAVRGGAPPGSGAAGVAAAGPVPDPSPWTRRVEPSALVEQMRAVDQFYKRHPTSLDRKEMNPAVSVAKTLEEEKPPASDMER